MPLRQPPTSPAAPNPKTGTDRPRKGASVTPRPEESRPGVLPQQVCPRSPLPATSTNTLIPSPYALSGTHIACGEMACWGYRLWGGARDSGLPMVPKKRIAWPEERGGGREGEREEDQGLVEESAIAVEEVCSYALPTPCPVLAYAYFRYCPMPCPFWYWSMAYCPVRASARAFVLSGTDGRYGATLYQVRSAYSALELAVAQVSFAICYALGTVLQY
eukprot:1620199-Rhodomonas_salina.2